MRSFRVARGGLGKQPLAAFFSFGAQKKIYSLLRPKGRRLCVIRNTLSKFSSCSGTLRISCPSQGYLDFPPPTRGPHKMHAFCGEPHSGFPTPVLETSYRPLTWEYCLAPSCGFPQKPFPPAGPHGFRGHLRRSGMRASEDGASTAPPCYAACNAPATRSDGALPTHYRPALGTHTVAAALKRANAL